MTKKINCPNMTLCDYNVTFDDVIAFKSFIYNFLKLY